MSSIRKMISLGLISASLFTITASYAETPIEDNLQRAKTTGQVLHEIWYKQDKGQWVGNFKGPNDYWWDSANSMISLLYLTEVTDYQVSYQSAMENTFNKGKNQNNFINSYNDDTLWWALTWLKAYQVTKHVNPEHPQLNDMLNVVTNIFTTMQKNQWDNTFNGGVWWSTARGSNGYKNAITNGLFLTLSSQLAHEFPTDSTYLTWAKKSWEWYKNSGMINADYLVNDGLSSSGVNNNGITWTYNQGMLIGGLVGLFKVTGDTAYLIEAQKLANAAMLYLADTNLNVLQDICEWKNACVPNPNSGQFKGVFMRYFIELTEVTYDPELRAKYKKFILDSADSNWENNRNVNNQFGHMWTGSTSSAPNNAPDPILQTSSLNVFIAAVRAQQL